MVKLTNINDFMIAMTSFLKIDKLTPGVGRQTTVAAPAAVGGLAGSLQIKSNKSAIIIPF